MQQLDNDQGRMAQVYLATRGEGSAQQTVALKIAKTPDPRGELFTEALQNEAAHLSHLHHPHIVKLLPIAEAEPSVFLAQTGLPESAWFIVLEYLPDASLATQLVQAAPQGLALHKVLTIGYALASALDYLHAHQRIHLDIKPANILFRRPCRPEAVGETVLIDFGSTRTINQGVLNLQTTFQPSPYLAPEWVMAAHQGSKSAIPATPSIDIYALGATLYQMLAGQPPFMANERTELEKLILDGNPPPPSQFLLNQRPGSNDRKLRTLADRLDQMILATLRREPTQRPGANLLAEQLAELQNRWGQSSAPLVPEPAAPPVPRRQWGFGALLLCAGLGIGAGVRPVLDRPIRDFMHGIYATPTVLATATFTPTQVPTATSAPTAAASATFTPLPTPTPTPLPTETATNAPTATPTLVPTETATPPSTLAATAGPSPTNTPRAEP